MIHQLSHELMDPEREFSNPHNVTVKCFYIAVSIGTGFTYMIILNIDTLFSMVLLTMYLNSLIVYVMYIPEIRIEIWMETIFCIILVTLVAI